MIIGYVIRRLGIVDEHFATVANRYVFKVSLPVLLFRDLSTADFKTDFDLKFVLFCFIVTFLMFSLTWLFTEIFMKDDSMKGAFVQASCRSSAAILGIAFIENIYADAGMAPLMIVAAVPLFNIFAVIILTFKAHPELHGKPANTDLSKKDTIKKAAINIAKNPIIIGILLGLASSLADFTYPAIINKTIANIAQTATPIALICIGASFEGSKAIKKIKPTIIASFIKLILLAAIFVPIAIFMGFRNQELIAILVMLASPTTVTCFVMAKAMDNDEVLSSSIVVLTTLLSSVTLTAWIFILRSFALI
jgi:predicted permease